MRVLTVNTGSSSIRLASFEADHEGVRQTATRHLPHDPGAKHDALAEFVAQTGAVDAVAHRVVHGGPDMVQPRRIDAEVEAEIDRLSTLAPLHNPTALAWIRACRAILGEGLPQVAVFDTAFFAGLPEVARTYAVPRALAARHGLRRYGFHGIAHEAMWRRWAHRGSAGGGRIISLQLGAGCSMTAVREGHAVDTSMGFSPLEGLVMATRSGDIDPGMLAFVQRAEGMSPDRLEHLLNESSGLLGVSGASGDMQALLASPHQDARLAVELYCYRARKYLGAYLAVLGGADAILFGGGVGEHAPAVRAAIVENMGWAGIELDAEANRVAVGSEARIDAAASRVQVWVIPVDEAAILAEAAQALFGGA